MAKLPTPPAALATGVTVPDPASLRRTDRLLRALQVPADEIQSGRFRTPLYRFLADSIPVVSACIWTWARLAAAPGHFHVDPSLPAPLRTRVENRLDQLLERIYTPATDTPNGGADFAVDLATSLFRDGRFGGFLTIDPSGHAVDRFLPLDSARITLDTENGRRRFLYETETGPLTLDRPDFYFVPLSGGVNAPLGRSILQSIPFVAYIEQQLVDDMRRSSHNAGFHRLHVRITPPERLSGEADNAYIDRINSYFDSTVSMIRSCDVDDNPVTWDNVAIDYIGPDSTRSVTNSWFFSHRAMIEEICAGTNLAPFLLGYSYGATTSWSGFKFDLVMRQVRTIQAEMARLFEWIAAIDLALAGLAPTMPRVRYEFDNTLAYQAGERSAIESARTNNLIRLYESGLIDKQTAIAKAAALL